MIAPDVREEVAQIKLSSIVCRHFLVDDWLAYIVAQPTIAGRR